MSGTHISTLARVHLGVQLVRHLQRLPLHDPLHVARVAQVPGEGIGTRARLDRHVG